MIDSFTRIRLTLTGLQKFVPVWTVVFCSQGMGIECAKHVKNKYIHIYMYTHAKQDIHKGIYIDINA